jgi:hypothetical protein
MRKMLAIIASGVFLTGLTGAISAAPQWCQGTMSNLFVSSDGTVYVLPSYRADYTRICNLNTETGGVSVVNCAAWLAMLRNAVQRQSTVLVYYGDVPACNSIPTYGAAPLPGYVMQMN